LFDSQLSLPLRKILFLGHEKKQKPSDCLATHSSEADRQIETVENYRICTVALRKERTIHEPPETCGRKL